jgi:biotin transport system substrate-specific component
MTTLTTALRRPKPITIGWVIGFSLALTAAAQITIPIPGTPVPFTLQPLLVVLAGLMLGPAAGAASMALYLVAGAIGLPVFSPVGAPGIARFFGPTGGYLIAYPVAAFVAGALAGKQTKFVRRFLAASAGVAVIFAGGIAQLAIITGSLPIAIAQGITPFFGFDIVKAMIAAAATGSRARRTG